MNMEHMNKRWMVGWEDNRIAIITVDPSHPLPYTLCAMYNGLPGDDNGRLTAQAICDEHNAALNEKLKNTPKE